MQDDLEATFARELSVSFPGLPATCAQAVIAWAFMPSAVGYDVTLPLPKRVYLAVVAHARHAHSDYDVRIRLAPHKPFYKRWARKSTRAPIQQILLAWRRSPARAASQGE